MHTGLSSNYVDRYSTINYSFRQYRAYRHISAVELCVLKSIMLNWNIIFVYSVGLNLELYTYLFCLLKIGMRCVDSRRTKIEIFKSEFNFRTYLRSRLVYGSVWKTKNHFFFSKKKKNTISYCVMYIRYTYRYVYTMHQKNQIALKRRRI